MTALDALREADRALLAASPLPLPVVGLEAVVTGAIAALDASDWWVPGLRERAGGALRGAPADRLAHGARPYKIGPSGPDAASRAAVAVGLAVGSGRATLVHLGVGSAAQGAFHEALNLAAATSAPVIFLVAVHPLTGPAPLPPQLHAHPARLAEAFGLGVATVDGTDAAAIEGAVRAAKQAGGPHLIEARLAAPQENSDA